MRVRSIVALFFASAIGVVVACGSETGPDGGGTSGQDSGSTQSSTGFINSDSSAADATKENTGCLTDCAKLGATCGPAGDGCGGLIQCGTCEAPDTCGGGGTPSKCGGGTSTCKPKTCADYPAKSCGPLADGCGGLLECGECTAPEYCGGGGTSLCGGNSGCKPKTVADCGAQNCGPLADGCGGVVQCGTCGANESCGAGGAGKCGPAGGGTCVPKTCPELGITCGPAGDGCGNQLECGTCTAPATCGGGGTPSKCGGTTGCQPKTCPQLGATCGPAGDGCGGTIQCGSCDAPQTCGGGGTPSACGGNNACKPKTCADYPANSCGPLSDGCGDILTNCGVGPASNCPAGTICGGGGVPSVCGGGSLDGGVDGGACTTGLCTQQVSCPGGGTTTLTGTVVSPRTCAGAVCNVTANAGDADPIPNVTVFVPNGGAAAVKPFTAGVQCDQCGGAGAQDGVLVSTTTGADGKFTLSNVPVGANIPVVIQIGRWRRIFTINVSKSCQANAAGDLHLPANKTQGDIPLTAIGTGAVDTLECVLRKIGIEDTEFTAPSGSGRIHLYVGDADRDGNRGHHARNDNTSWTTLYGNATQLAKYDQLIFDCNGDPSKASMNDADRGRLRDYLNTGGRLFATHYEYVWLSSFAPFSGTAQWHVDQPNAGNQAVLGDIDTSFPKGALFASWLGNVNSLAQVSPPKISMNVSRHDLDPLPAPPGTGVVSPAQRWISVDPKLPNGSNFPTQSGGQNPQPLTNYVGAPQHYTFNTPWGSPAANQCGRVLYSDFHVLNASLNGDRFPNGCGGSRTDPLSPQEKVIEFMLFDLGSCITPDNPVPPPSCTPLKCPTAPGTCGQMADGCGGVLSCGTCTKPQTCGGGGTANVCGGTGCTPRTCTQANANCGPVADGCGLILDCGTCTAPQTCGGAGVPSQCGNPTCLATTCAEQGISCGPAGDGCGHLLQCGDCTAPLTCGGGGSPGVCGNSTCKPLTCTAQGIECGPAGNGCGGQLECGDCPSGQVCGGAGPSKCGSGTCVPRTCAQAGANCGPIGDGCGGQLDCGPCSQGQSCGGGGTPNVCGGCTRTSCAAIGAECGPIGDGCGGIIDCGVCTKAGDTCGGGGIAFKCGQVGVH